jgi:hypothetical protein
MNELSTIISLVTLFLLILEALVQRFVFDAKILERLKDVELKSNLFWGLVEKELPKILHSPHTPVLDSFLEKMVSKTLTAKDKVILGSLLQEELKAETSPDYGRRLVVVLLLAQLQHDKQK